MAEETPVEVKVKEHMLDIAYFDPTKKKKKKEKEKEKQKQDQADDFVDNLVEETGTLEITDGDGVESSFLGVKKKKKKKKPVEDDILNDKDADLE
ncbi:hypothetical protein ACOSQ3_028372 [Xanthoceras sorbifolium]